MAVYRGPRLPRHNRVVLAYDIGVTRSYPDSGATVTDMARGGNNGTITGATYSSPNGGALEYDGAGDYILIPPTGILDLQQFTISTWVYSTNFLQNGFLFEKTTNGVVNTQYSLFFESVTSSLRFRIMDPSFNDISCSYTLCTASAWNHIVATISPTVGDRVLYVNNNAEATSIIAPGTINTSPAGNSWIGTYAGGVGYPFNGYIANTYIWDQALSADEVTELYNFQKGRYK